MSSLYRISTSISWLHNMGVLFVRDNTHCNYCDNISSPFTHKLTCIFLNIRRQNRQLDCSKYLQHYEFWTGQCVIHDFELACQETQSTFLLCPQLDHYMIWYNHHLTIQLVVDHVDHWQFDCVFLDWIFYLVSVYILIYGGNPGNIRGTAFCFNRMVLHGICWKNYICVTFVSNTRTIKWIIFSRSICWYMVY